MVVLVAMAATAASCGSVGGDDEEASETLADTRGGIIDRADLADCPNPIVIQTDWYPQPEFGSLYQLTAGKGRIDDATGVFTGPLAADPSVRLEIRSGAPYVDFESPLALAAADDEILLAMVDTDEAIDRYEEIPSVAVVAPLEVSPRMLMWDPDTYDVDGWIDLDETGAPISHLSDAYYIEYLVAAGLLSPIQLEDTYDGSATQFISEDGALIQEGTVTRDPFNYTNYFDEWARPIGTLLIHDAGYTGYDGALNIPVDRLSTALRSCLRAFVPLVQQGIVEFQEDPSVTNDLIVRLVRELDTEWKVTRESVFDSVLRMGADGLVSNGTDKVVGNLDDGRIDEMLTIARDQLSDVEVPPELRVDDLFSNDFIDPGIGL